MEEKLPRLSILTPTANRAKFLSFGIHNLRITNYPLDLIEWVILDDGDEPYIPNDRILEEIKKILHPVRIIYKYTKQKYNNIGEKRNATVRLSTEEYLVNMDDDDIYTSDHITNGIRILLQNKRKISLVGHSANIVIYPYSDYQLTYNRCQDLIQITENTMIFTRKHWKVSGFAKTKTMEGKGMTEGITGRVMLYDSENWSVLQVAHKTNTVNKDKFLHHNINNNIFIPKMTVDLIRFVLKVDPSDDYQMTDDNKQLIRFGDVKKEIDGIQKI